MHIGLVSSRDTLVRAAIARYNIERKNTRKKHIEMHSTYTQSIRVHGERKNKNGLDRGFIFGVGAFGFSNRGCEESRKIPPNHVIVRALAAVRGICARIALSFCSNVSFQYFIRISFLKVRSLGRLFRSRFALSGIFDAMFCSCRVASESV